MKFNSMIVMFSAGLIASGLTLSVSTSAWAGDFATRCAGCHQTQLDGSGSVASRLERKGPPLFYAGNKFRKEWLVKWLQHPERIRPAGDFPPNHVKPTADGDVVDAETLIKHPVLDAKAAEEAADWLMSLKSKDDLVSTETYKPGRVSKRMGAMNFVKFKGCAACHRDTPEYGGFSGPELYTAFGRLQPAYIFSYIKNPVAWDATSLMPNKHLQTKQISQIVDYLRLIYEEGKKQ